MAKYLDKEGLETYEATVKGRLQNKQDTLESGTNIKTINNESLLGSGNITIQGGGGTATDVKINGTSITSNNEADIITQGTYNSSTNKIATMSDIPTVPTVGNAKTYYGTSSTSASTAAKTVTCSGFTLETGATIFVKFTNGNSYNGTATLNVNSTGAKDIATVGDTKTSRYYWKSGEIVGFVYDGTNYVMIEKAPATTTYYGITKLSSSTSSTSEAVAATPKAVKTAYDLANGKQDKLVSGTSIKTINSTSLLGSGDISVVATETDPVFSASAASGITSTDITNWNEKLDYTELSGNSVRIWDLSTGLYLQTAAAYLYYNGSTDTTKKTRIGEGTIIIVGGSSSRKEFITISGECYVGYTTSSAGEIHETLFTGDIANNLTTTNEGHPLDATQGKALKDLIDGLATVATSGSYSDLSNTPTIPTNTSDLTNDSNFAVTNANNNFSASQSITGDLTVSGTIDGNVKQTLVENTSGQTLHIPLVDSTGTGAKTIYNTSGLGVWNKQGTTSATGRSELILGNNTNAGTAGNKDGTIRLWSAGTGSNYIAVNGNHSSTYWNYLPQKQGTIALEPVTIYTNTNGTKTSITTLTNNVSEFSYLEIFYGWDTAAYGLTSTKVDISLDKTINLSTTVYNNSRIYWATSKWTASNKNLTLNGGEWWSLGTSGSGTRNQSNNVAIFKILGYK